MYAKYAKYIGIPCTYMNQVGPIPGGKEVVVQYSSDLNSNGKFFTGTLHYTGSTQVPDKFNMC